jgi:hypothetical protein
MNFGCSGRDDCSNDWVPVPIRSFFLLFLLVVCRTLNIVKIENR